MTDTKTFTKEDFIPSAYWGKDHWSTLAYLETVMVDCGGFQVGLDPRMRSNRRNYRVMHEECPRPKRAAGRLGSMGPTLDSGKGTRLSNGTEVEGHDDWSCVQDMAKEGLLNLSDADIEPGVTLQLSEKGKLWSDALREHKRAGKNFAEFTSDGLPAMPECKAKPREVFQWMSACFDVSAILADIDSGKLKPRREVLDAAFIANYAKSVLGVDKSKPRDVDQLGTLFMSISTKQALELPAEKLSQPGLVAFAGKNKGVLNLGTGADFVLCDGNHRIARAYLDDQESMTILVLSSAQTRKYRS